MIHEKQGHEVRLMAARYVKPYVKMNKNDYIDAEAIVSEEPPRLFSESAAS
jgi:transposase